MHNLDLELEPCRLSYSKYLNTQEFVCFPSQRSLRLRRTFFWIYSKLISPQIWKEAFIQNVVTYLSTFHERLGKKVPTLISMQNDCKKHLESQVHVVSWELQSNSRTPLMLLCFLSSLLKFLF